MQAELERSYYNNSLLLALERHYLILNKRSSEYNTLALVYNAKYKFHIKDIRSPTIYKGGISIASPDGPLKTTFPPLIFLLLNVVIYINI